MLAARVQTLAATLAATDHALTVIIPAYNEENRLPKSLQAIAEFLDNSGLDYRVIVADDGSHDATPQLAGQYGPRFSTVRLVQNGGKGRAVRAAMLAATGAVVAFTDADLPFRLTALVEGYQWIRNGECQIAFGSRHLAPSEHLAKRNVLRQIASHTFNSIVKLLVSTDVTDTQCGLKIFSRRAAVEIFSRTTVDGFAFDTEVVMLAQRLGLSHRCLPVTLVNEEASTVSLAKHALPMLRDVVKVRAHLQRQQLRASLAPTWGCLLEPARRAA